MGDGRREYRRVSGFSVADESNIVTASEHAVPLLLDLALQTDVRYFSELNLQVSGVYASGEVGSAVEGKVL